MNQKRGRIWVNVVVALLVVIALGALGFRYAIHILTEVPETVPMDAAKPDIATVAAIGDEASEDEVAQFDSKDFSLRRFLAPFVAKDPVEALKACHRWQRHRLKQVEAIPDYSMRLVKHEEVKGKLWPEETILAKIRHQPFSVYTKHVAPKSLNGQEAIYIEGRNNGKIVGHTVGLFGAIGGTQILDLRSALAMKGNRHPITDIGILDMLREEVIDIPNELKWDNFTVKFDLNAEVGGRPSAGYQITHKKQTPECDYFQDAMYFDEEYKVPTRYVRHGWPKKEGDQPPLLEEYQHLDLKFNQGFTDKDFDHTNPEYGY